MKEPSSRIPWRDVRLSPRRFRSGLGSVSPTECLWTAYRCQPLWVRANRWNRHDPGWWWGSNHLRRKWVSLSGGVRWLPLTSRNVPVNTIQRTPSTRGTPLGA